MSLLFYLAWVAIHILPGLWLIQKSNTCKIPLGWPTLSDWFCEPGWTSRHLEQLAHSVISPGHWRPHISPQIVPEPQEPFATSASCTWLLHLTWPLLGALHFQLVSSTPTLALPCIGMETLNSPLFRACGLLQSTRACVEQSGDLSLQDRGRRPYSKIRLFVIVFPVSVPADRNVSGIAHVD